MEEKILRLNSEKICSTEIAKLCGVSYATVRRILIKNDKKSICKRTLRDEDISNIISLHESGLSNKDIAKQVKRSGSTISYILKKNGLIPNGKKFPLQVHDGLGQCRKCERWLDLTYFYLCKNKNGNFLRKTICKDCALEEKYKYLNSSIEIFLKKRHYDLRRRKKEFVIFDITSHDLIEQYYTQDGKCFYTGVEMEWGWKKLNRSGEFILSVDKIIPEFGYIKGNFVFCTSQVNICKSNTSLPFIESWMPLWYEKIYEKLKVDGNLDWLVED